MAERRMFTMKIVDSDAFLDMPMSAQSLYFHLNMRADDDGFVNNPKKIQRMIGASDDDLKLLLVKRFILGFENGIVVIKHWRMHNLLRKDRYNPTQYIEQKATLEIKEDGAYTEKNAVDYLATTWQPNGNQMATQDRIGKESIVKESIGECISAEPTRAPAPKKQKRKKPPAETNTTLFERISSEFILSDSLTEKLKQWIQYKTERKDEYTEQGLRSLLRRIENKYLEFHKQDQTICELIDESMSNNWKGIIFDRLKPPIASKGSFDTDDFFSMAVEKSMAKTAGEDEEIRKRAEALKQKLS